MTNHANYLYCHNQVQAINFKKFRDENLFIDLIINLEPWNSENSEHQERNDRLIQHRHATNGTFIQDEPLFTYTNSIDTTLSSSIISSHEPSNNNPIEIFSLKCHRIIISSHIKYFRDMFKSNMKESTNNSITMKIQYPLIFTQIIDACYGIPLIIDSDNVDKILTISEYLGMEDLHEKAMEFVKHSLDPLHFGRSILDFRLAYRIWQICDSSYQISPIANEVDTKLLKTKAITCLLENCEKFYKSELINKNFIEEKHLIYLLSHDNLTIRNEALVQKIIQSFVGEDENDQKNKYLINALNHRCYRESLVTKSEMYNCWQAVHYDRMSTIDWVFLYRIELSEPIS